MSTEYINEFGERIIILGDGPQERRQERRQQDQELTLGSGGILQLVANTNFDTDDTNDYSTTSINIPISLNETISQGIKTYSIDIQTFVNLSDVTKFRYIKVEYTGQPNISELREMFVDWFIYSHQIGLITYHNMSIFKSQLDSIKIYSNADRNGGVIVYNLYHDVVCPNGLLRFMFAFRETSPLCFNFKEIPGLTINSVTLTATYKYLSGTSRRSEIEYYQTHGQITPKWQYFNTNAITVSLPEPSRTTNHNLDATGNVHGIFVKTNMVSIKIILNSIVYIHYTNSIDIQLNTVKFGDDGWVFVPFDLERTYERLSDCFVSDHNGGLELGRIYTINIQITHRDVIDTISYAFPAYMSLHGGSIISPELACRTPSSTMMREYNIFGLVFENRRINVPVKCSLCDILSNAEQSPAKATDICVISHEPINVDDAYAVCITCSKPMLLDCVISWLKTTNANDTCPHCRCKWREIDTNIKVYKQI